MASPRERPLSVIGQRLPKVDAWGKVTGETRFADDLVLPRMAYAKLLRAQHPHALIRRIDTTRAAAVPGVYAVITGRDFLQVRFGIMPVTQDEELTTAGKLVAIGYPVIDLLLLTLLARMLVGGGARNGAFRLRVKPGVFSTAPMLFLHGDADDYTPIGPCRAYADAIGKAGTPVEFVAIEGAHHKFDADDTKRYYGARLTRIKPDCPIEVDIDTLAEEEEPYDATSPDELGALWLARATQTSGVHPSVANQGAALEDLDDELDPAGRPTDPPEEIEVNER